MMRVSILPILILAYFPALLCRGFCRESLPATRQTVATPDKNAKFQTRSIVGFSWMRPGQMVADKSFSICRTEGAVAELSEDASHIVLQDGRRVRIETKNPIDPINRLRIFRLRIVTKTESPSNDYIVEHVNDENSTHVVRNSEPYLDPLALPDCYFVAAFNPNGMGRGRYAPIAPIPDDWLPFARDAEKLMNPTESPFLSGNIKKNYQALMRMANGDNPIVAVFAIRALLESDEIQQNELEKLLLDLPTFVQAVCVRAMIVTAPKGKVVDRIGNIYKSIDGVQDYDKVRGVAIGLRTCMLFRPSIDFRSREVYFLLKRLCNHSQKMEHVTQEDRAVLDELEVSLKELDAFKNDLDR